MKSSTPIAAFVFAALCLAALAAANSTAIRAGSSAGRLGIEWKAPTSCLGSAAYNVHIELTAPAGGAVVAGWLLTPAAFNVDGKGLTEREDKGSMALPEGARIMVDVDLGPYLKAEKDFELVYASGVGDDKPVAVKMLVPCPAGLNFMDEKSVPLAELAKYNVLLQTNRGDMTVEFWPDVAPGHVRNFLDLAYTNFYSGTTFHRLIPGFMIQGGDPTGTGAGDGPRALKAEFSKTVKHVPGVLSMARQGNPAFQSNPTQDPLKDTASCQFFIMHANYPSLDGGYSAFGKLVSGYETLEAIVRSPRGQGDKPLEPQKILKATVILAAATK